MVLLRQIHDAREEEACIAVGRLSRIRVLSRSLAFFPHPGDESHNLSSSGLGFNLVSLFFRCLGFRFLGFEEFARMMGISRIVCREFLRLVP